MALLLNRHGNEVKITEETLKEVASNRFISYEVVQLLHRAVTIKVTVGVIEAAATSRNQSLVF
jgi:hypothetical protein